MGLANYRTHAKRTEVIDLGDGDSMEVRSISLPDVAVLITAHEYTISSLAMKVMNRRELFEQPDRKPEELSEIMQDLIMEVLKDSPILAGNIIALCADEPEEMHTAAHLPLPIQIEALSVIADLTFKDPAAIKKLVAGVKKMIAGFLPTRMTPAQQ